MNEILNCSSASAFVDRRKGSPRTFDILNAISRLLHGHADHQTNLSREKVTNGSKQSRCEGDRQLETVSSSYLASK